MSRANLSTLSVEPMAIVTAPARMEAQHQSLLHVIGEGHIRSDKRALAKVVVATRTC